MAVAASSRRSLQQVLQLHISYGQFSQLRNMPDSSSCARGLA